MNKYQEALDNIKSGHYDEQDIATLQELVDKQKPMKPIIWEHKVVLKNRCSKCTEGLFPEDNYCSNCGQKIKI